MGAVRRRAASVVMAKAKVSDISLPLIGSSRGAMMSCPFLGHRACPNKEVRKQEVMERGVASFQRFSVNFLSALKEFLNSVVVFLSPRSRPPIGPAVARQHLMTSVTLALN